MMLVMLTIAWINSITGLGSLEVISESNSYYYLQNLTHHPSSPQSILIGKVPGGKGRVEDRMLPICARDFS